MFLLVSSLLFPPISFPVLFLFQEVCSTHAYKSTALEDEAESLFYSFYWTITTLSFYSAFLAPSISFAIFYIVVFIGTSCKLVLDYSQDENDQLKALALILSTGSVGASVVFYFLQKRELKRFLKTMELTESEQ